MNQTAGSFTPQCRCTAAVLIALSDLPNSAVTCLLPLSLGSSMVHVLRIPQTQLNIKYKSCGVKSR